MVQKICIECKNAPALYWDNNFCDKCISEIFENEYGNGRLLVKLSTSAANERVRT